LEITRRNSVHPEKRLGCRRIREIVLEVDGTLLHSPPRGSVLISAEFVTLGGKRPNLTNQAAIESKAPASVITKGFVGRDARGQNSFRSENLDRRAIAPKGLCIKQPPRHRRAELRDPTRRSPGRRRKTLASRMRCAAAAGLETFREVPARESVNRWRCARENAREDR